MLSVYVSFAIKLDIYYVVSVLSKPALGVYNIADKVLSIIYISC